MKRMIALVLLAGISLTFALGLGTAAGQDKKDDKKTDVPKEVTIFDKPVSEWIKILRTHEKPNYRQAALIALESSNTARSSGLPAILDCIEKDKDEKIRVLAVNLLGRLGGEVKPAIKALVGALQADKSDKVREAAAAAIAANPKLCDQASDYVDALVGALKDPHPGTRVAIASALRNMGENAKPGFPALLEAAANPKEHLQVRTAAVHVVSRFPKDNPKALPLLVDLSKGSDTPAALREAAVDGLGRSGSDAPEVSAALGITLADKSLELRKASATALGTLGAKAKTAWPAVKPRLSDANEPDSGVRNHLIRLTGVFAKTTDEAIPVLTAVAKDDTSTENRIAAIQELAEQGPRAKSAVDTLSKIASADARFAIREAAEKAVAQITSGK
jgi:HEAT repeat protein